MDLSTLRLDAAMQDADLALAGLEAGLLDHEAETADADRLTPWLGRTAQLLRRSPSEPMLDQVAAALRSTLNDRIDLLPRAVGQMQRDMSAQGLDHGRLDLVLGFLNLFNKLLGA